MSTPKKIIIFVCIGNSCRSQTAEGFLRHGGREKFETYSAGARPAGYINPRAIAVMKEKGIDLSGQYSESLEEIPLEKAEVVITMGCGDGNEVCPVVPAVDKRDWNILDPVDQPIEIFRRVRDDIERKVKELAEELSRPRGGE